jgi:hypothetical protein
MWNIGQLCHFPVATSRKVQEFGHIGYGSHSTPPMVGSYYLNLYVMLIFTSALNILNLSKHFDHSLIG